MSRRTSVLRMRSKGPEVEALQRFMNNRVKPTPKLKVDGKYGKVMESVVKEFQIKNKLKADGMVGAKTLGKFGGGAEAIVMDNGGGKETEGAKKSKGSSKARELKGQTKLIKPLRAQASKLRKEGVLWLKGMGDFEKQLGLVGDDAQLAEIDLQSSLQKQQQTLQVLTTLNKTMHDTEMAIIRKIGG